MSERTSILTRGKQGLLLVSAAITLVVVAVGSPVALPHATATDPQVRKTNGVTVVHYFPPKAEGMHVGHVSMSLADGTYISWVPQKRRLVSPVAPDRTLAADVAFEEESPVDYPVQNLNTDDMKTWWEQFRQSNKFWVANGPNCTTVVEAALRAGGADGIPSGNDVWFPLALRPTLEQLTVSGTSVVAGSATVAQR